MATYNVGGVPAAKKASPWLGMDRTMVLELVLDLSKRNLAAAGYASGDVIVLCDIPAGFLVQNFTTQVMVVEGAAGTINVGDTGSATRYHSALSINALAFTAGTATAQMYSADDQLKVVLGGTLANSGTAKIAFHAVLVDYNARGAAL